MGPAPVIGSPSAQRPPHRGSMQNSGKPPFNMPMPPQGAKPPVAQYGGSGAPIKREIVFPSDSIEAVTPLLYRRKRLNRGDIGTTDPWRIFMSLQSGLLSESTWALDVLNILLFDDSSIQYFGLNHLPGLLKLLLDHFQKNLGDMFDVDAVTGRHRYEWSKPTKCTKRSIKAKQTKTVADECDDALLGEETEEEADTADEDDENNNDIANDGVDLGQVNEVPSAADRLVVLQSTNNYTLCSRKGLPVKIKEADDDIFVLNDKRLWDKDFDQTYQFNSTVGDDAWSFGQTQPHPYDHIIDSFKGEFVNIPFAKYVKNSKSDKTKRNSTSVKVPNGVAAKTEAIDKAEATTKDEAAGDKATSDKVKEEKSDDGEVVEKEKEIEKKSDAEDSNDFADDKKEEKKSEVTDMEVDSDCREVDMELERIPNGPQSGEAAAVDDEDSTDAKKCNLKRSAEIFDVRSTVNDPAETLKRRRVGDYEDECYARDEATLHLINENHDTLARRCVCISNILRNLTFVPGNELVFANSETFLAVLGKILLLHHEHPIRQQTIRNYDREDDTDFADSCSSLQGESEWWWDYLIQLRENMMVAIANIAGHMQLSKFDEIITRPCLDGLLHWAVCPSAHGQDPFPSCGPHSVLSPQRLALEALCKLCVTDANVDLVIATPPFSRLEKLCSVLTRHLCRNEDQVLREFSVNLLHYLAAADSAMARTVAMQSPCISYLVAFIEQAEQTALGVANQHGISFLRENPDSMGTSLDMLRRAAGTLLHLARHPDNRPLFLQQEQRLLGLVMSHILDQQVALIISRVLYQVSRGAGSVSLSSGADSRAEAKKAALKSMQPPPQPPAAREEIRKLPTPQPAQPQTEKPPTESPVETPTEATSAPDAPTTTTTTMTTVATVASPVSSPPPAPVTATPTPSPPAMTTAPPATPPTILPEQQNLIAKEPPAIQAS